MYKVIVRFNDNSENYCCLDGDYVCESSEDDYIRVYKGDDFVGMFLKNAIKVVYKTEKTK